jgi:hypothetical protein
VLPPGCNLVMTWKPTNESAVKLTVFLSAMIVAFALRSSTLLATYLILVTLLITANTRVFAGMSVRERNAAVLLTIILSLILPISLLRNETATVHYAVALTAMAAGFILTRNLQVYLWASRATLVLAQALTLGYLFRRGVANFPLEEMLPESSANGVTSYLLLMQVNYCIVNFLLRRRGSLLTASVTVAISIVGYSRGSILASGAVLAIGLVVQLHSRTPAQLFSKLVGAAIVVGAVGLVYGDEVGQFVLEYTKIGSGLADPHRALIVREYLDKIDPLTLLTGASYAGTSVAGRYNGNPHVSYIRAHHIFGLAYLVFMLAVPVYLVRREHSLVVKAYSSCMWLIVLFRAVSEPILFPTPFDLYYFAACFALSKLPSALSSDRVSEYAIEARAR